MLFNINFTCYSVTSLSILIMKTVLYVIKFYGHADDDVVCILELGIK